MKFYHKLRANRNTELPSEFIFVDTETAPFSFQDLQIHRLKLGVACHVQVRNSMKQNTEHWFYFTQPAEFWDWVDKRVAEKKKLYLYAHNMHFDFFVLDSLQELARLKWELKSFYIKSDVFIMKLKNGSKTLVILDSGNIVKLPLQKIGEIVGIAKKEIDFGTCTEQELKDYCKQDVKILKNWILRFREFIKKHDLGSYRETIASQAMYAFRHRFMEHKIAIHDDPKVYELERKAYRGGRTECFFIGRLPNGRYYLLDVNSMYPYMMRKHSYPTALCFKGKACSVAYLKYMLKRYAVIAKVLVKVREPFLPFGKEKLIFPTGYFWTTLTTEELKKVLKEGKVLKVAEYACYSKAPIFKRYVDYFYAMKEKHAKRGNLADYQISKLLLNCLYGKFGQKAEKLKEVGSFPENLNFIEHVIDADTNERRTEYHILGKTYILEEAGETIDSFPAISAHVTANARLYLWNLIKKAGLRNVFYCDTDSLLVNEKGKQALRTKINSRKLGMLSITIMAEEVEIRGAKDYRFGELTKIKGIGKHARLIGKNTWEQEQFLKFRSMLRKGIQTGAATKTIIKTLRRQYDKGKVLRNGFVVPFSLPLPANQTSG